MDTIELEDVVSRHEIQSLELKESFGVECIETACAFANAGGGYIVVGVDDKGLPSTHALRGEGLRDYENKILTATEPSVAVDAEKVSFGGREVVVLKVMENPLKPVAYKGRCFMRKGSVNHQMTPTEIAECHLKSTGSSMDAVFVPGVSKGDLDMDAVRRYMRQAVSKGRRSYSEDDDPWDVLMKLEWVKSESEITRAAYLLFAKDPQRKFSQAIVHAGAFKDDGAVIYDTHDSVGNIQDQVEDALAFIKKCIHCALVITPGKADHDSVWDYPLKAVRETLANAICHRDYGVPYDVQVGIYEDSLRISSPGRLPFDMPMEMLMNPRHASRPRNKIIAQAFYDMGVIERYGGGIKRIKNDCDKNGNDYPTWSDRQGEFVTEYRPRKIEMPDSTEKVTENGSEVTEKVTENGSEVTEKVTETQIGVMENVVDKSFTNSERAILRIIKQDRSITQEAIAKALELSRPYVGRVMLELQRRHAIRRKGPDKGGFWEVL